jgi:DNA-binding LacI/PurR family transcriptional regulator
VGTDHFANGRTLYRALLARGFRRIGLCFTAELDRLTDHGFKPGVWSEQEQQADMTEHIPHLQMPDWDIGRFSEWYARWRPEVIITQSTRVFAWLRQSGFRVPDDVGIAVPSTAPGYRNSGIDQNYPVMGREAVRLLWDKLIPTRSYGIPEFPLRLTIPSSWNEGETMGFPLKRLQT